MQLIKSNLLQTRVRKELIAGAAAYIFFFILYIIAVTNVLKYFISVFLILVPS